MTGFDELADELYLIPPAQFTAARGAVVTAARNNGDKATAADLSRLRKPTVSAWLVNRLVRAVPNVVAGVLAIGPAVRDATAAGDRAAMRDLTRHRQALLRDLVTEARHIAEDVAQTFTATTQREIEATFTAAAADPDVAATVLQGRLTAPLEFAGLGFDHGAVPPHRSAETSSPSPSPSSSSSSASPPGALPTAATRVRRPPGPDVHRSTRSDTEQEARAQALADAERALAAARLQHADAAAGFTVAQAAFDRATEAEHQTASAHRAARSALSDSRADLTAAKADAAAAQRVVAAALARLEKLTGRR